MNRRYVSQTKETTRMSSHRARLSAASLALTVLAVAYMVTAALAVTVRTYTASFGTAGTAEAQFGANSPTGAALDQGSGALYVADTGNSRIEKFDPSDNFVAAWGWGVDDGSAAAQVCSSGCQAGISGNGPGQFSAPAFVAVDNSGGPSAGSVYVADTATNLVQKLDSSGNLVTSWGSGGQLNGSTSPHGPFGALAGIAVDAAGNLLVYQTAFAGYLFKFAQDGTFITDFTTARSTLAAGLAVDSDGDFYKVNGDRTVQKFSASGANLGRVTTSSAAAGIAVDPSTDELYVALATRGERYAFNDSGQVVQPGSAPCTFSTFSGCNPTETFGTSDISSGSGVAVTAAGGRTYISDRGARQIDTFGALTVPGVATGAASNVTPTAATLNGTVNPDAISLTDCHFEYVTSVAFQSTGFSDLSSGGTVPCSPGFASIPADSSDHAVSANLDALTPATAYRFRLVASNANGTGRGQAQLLTPAFSIVPGSVIGKAHPTVPLLVVGGELDPQTARRADRDGIKAAPFVSQAGAHPDATGAGDLVTAGSAVKDFIVETPPGFVGNPTAVPACSRVAFHETTISGDPAKQCSPASQIGVASITNSVFDVTTPVYRISASPGHPASFGFKFFGVIINADLRTDGDYGLSVGATDISGTVALEKTTVTLWGVPADPIHDPDRWNPAKGPLFEGFPIGDWGASSGLPLIPFTQTAADCNASDLRTTARVDSWQNPGHFLPTDPDDPNYAVPAPQPTGCDKLHFQPEIAIQPSITNTDSPTGVSVKLEVPQNQDPDGLATPPLRKAVVTLPEGMTINPAAADGLAACTTEQIGLLTTEGEYPNPIRFARGDANCPQAAKIGRAVVNTALLDEPVEGDIYQAAPFDNPFGSFFAIYIVLRGPGFVVKLPAEVEADPQTGQLTTTVDHSPQLPFDELRLEFFGGPRSALATPQVCGTHTLQSELTPWSAPQSGPPAERTSSFESSAGSGGTPCANTLAERPFDPSFSAGSVNPVAGAHTPFVLSFRRQDGDQEIKGLQFDLPPGLAADISGVPPCSQAALAAAASRTGAQELASPSCPAASRVGRVRTFSGVGGSPLVVDGSAYLAGPHDPDGAGPRPRAPMSVAVITPAKAGPFDLGVVVVRTALYIDPDDAQIHAVSGQIPHILKGIPLRVREVRVLLDRSNFTVNPTNCDPMKVTGRIIGAGGDLQSAADDVTVARSDRFQVGDCGALGFSPRFITQALGRKGFGRHPTFRAVLTMPGGQANIKRVTYKLPKSLTIDQRFTTGLCTESQLARSDCAGARVYGRAVARTPLLGFAPSGPVYLVSGAGGLPRLAMILRGPAWQPIKLVVRGRTFGTRDGGYRTVIYGVPDAPVSRFTLTLFGSKQSIIQDTRNLCRSRLRGRVAMIAHNNRTIRAPVKLATPGCRKARRR